MNFSPHMICACLAALLALCPPSIQAHEETELIVGRNAAGKLVIHADFEQPVALGESIFPGIPGYATAELAFHSAIVDVPNEDFFQLSSAASISFILLAKDPGMEVLNDTGTGYMQTNQSFFIGTPIFDSHPIWNLVSGTSDNIYSLTVKLHDTNEVHLNSDPFVLSFTPIQIRHRIQIAKDDPLLVTLSWPTNAAGWELQSATSATATTWNVVTNNPVIVQTNFTLSIATSEAQQFFRLRRP